MRYSVKLKTIHEQVQSGDGARVLVDAALPKEKPQGSLGLDEWYSKAAPSIALRKALRKDEISFIEFVDAYRQELKHNTDALAPLLKYARRGELTLLTAIQDTERSHLPVLRQCIIAELNKEDQQSDDADPVSPTCYGGQLEQ